MKLTTCALMCSALLLAGPVAQAAKKKTLENQMQQKLKECEEGADNPGADLNRKGFMGRSANRRLSSSRRRRCVVKYHEETKRTIRREN